MILGDRFTYEEVDDGYGNFLGTQIIETGGYFANVTPEEVMAIAENLYPEFDPEFKRDGMQQEFYEIHFNYCLRRRLEACSKSQHNTTTQTTAPDSQTCTTESGLSNTNMDTVFSSD